MGSGSKSQTSTTQMVIPDFLKAPLTGAVQAATSRYNTATPYDRTYVDYSPETEAALARTMALAGNPSTGGIGNAQNNLNATLRGDFLHGGAGFNRAFNAAASAITPRVTSAFNQANRMGGLAGQGELTRQLGDAFAGLYGDERNRQMQGLSMVPAMQSAAYDPVSRMLGVGQMREAKDMERLQDEQYRNNFGDVSLDQYIQRLSALSPGMIGQSTTTTGGSGRSMLGTIAGLGMIAAGAAMGGPVGAGAASGLLSGGSLFTGPGLMQSGLSLAGQRLMRG